MKTMKTMKQIGLVLVAVTMLLCATLLVACGESTGTGCTEHKWDSGTYDVVPECGSGITSTKTYTCRVCGEIMKKTVQAAASHSIETVIVREATCMENGVKKLVCKYCGYARDEMPIAARGYHSWDIKGAELSGDKKIFSCADCDETEIKNTVVYYSEFGAIGNGKVDDSDAMRDAHAYANEWGLDVKGEAGKTYYIGVIDQPIVIKTNTDWCGAKIIIDDSKIPLVYDPKQPDGSKWTYHYTRTVQVFSIERDADAQAQSVRVPTDFRLKAGQENIGLTFAEPVMLKIENSNEKINIRYGVNGNEGENKHEMILVDAQGNVDPSTPIQYDYDEVTSITAYPIDDASITVGNAEIVTIVVNPEKDIAAAKAANTYPDGADVNYINNYCYFNRGFGVTRSNVTITDIDHKVLGEFYNKTTGDYTEFVDAYNKTTDAYYTLGVPYNGFFYATNAYNATVKDSMIYGHKEYALPGGAMGSYEIGATDCIGLTYSNLTQRGDITDRTNLHGVMGTNYIRNTLVKDSYFDRVDVHQGAHNMTVKDSTLGLGILIIGGGTLYVEKVEATGTYGGGGFIHLRTDYNSVFKGDVIVKNVTLCNKISSLIVGTYVGNHYSGLPNYMTTSLTVDGLKVAVSTFSFYGISSAYNSTELNPLIVPTSITVSNITGCNSYRASANPGDLFSSVPITEK